MRLDQRGLRYAATDVAGFTACRHLTRLEMAAAQGRLRRPAATSLSLEALKQRGEDHERAVLEEFRAKGWRILPIPDTGDDAAGAAHTLQGLHAGVDVVYQGVLIGGERFGRPDFLVRAALIGGGDGYEVIDAKLARSAKAQAVLQAAFYSRLLGDVLGVTPRRLHLALGNRNLATFRVAAVDAYERQADSMFRSFLDPEPGTPFVDTYPDPTEYCCSCRWGHECAARRRADDDLSLVAGITSRQRVAFQAAGITTRRALAAMDIALPLDGVGKGALERVHAQARLQVHGEDEGRMLWEFVTPQRDEDGSPAANRGLLALPAPSPGDLFFDIEGARHYSEDGKEFGLQYLFGIVDSAYVGADGRPAYRAFWAFNRAQEKAAFEALVDFIAERMAQNPKAHVYHYNHYEPTSMDHLRELHMTREAVMGQLMGRFATREDVVDNLLRREVFVDLYRVVRQGIRASVESYSIKRLEPLYDFRRQILLSELNHEMVQFELDIESGHARVDLPAAAVVRGYNEDDCRSTQALRDWLEARRSELAVQLGAELPRPSSPQVSEQAPEGEVANLRATLLAGLPEKTADRTAWQNARSLIADLLEYYRREDKPMWWRYFYLKKLTDDELIEEKDALAGLQFSRREGRVKNSELFWYRFPEQEHGFVDGDAVEDVRTGDKWTIHVLDEARGELAIGRGVKRIHRPHPTALIAGAGEFRKRTHSEAIRDIARGMLTSGESMRRSTVDDILLRRRPAVDADIEGPLRRAEDIDAVDAARRCVMALDTSYLPVQGPPGTGKTYTSAEQILCLVEAKRKVGVTATSHAVIFNALEALRERAAKTGVGVRLGQKPDDGKQWLHPQARLLKGINDVRVALDAGEVDVVGATTWCWTHAGMRDAVDVLFIDEAGQMSVADALGSTLSTKSVVLLGDPRQLAHPSKGTHPPGAGVSVLDHILGEHTTIPDDLGLFIEQTRRMHPSITAFISDVFYEGRLTGIEGLELQAVLGGGLLSGSGLRFVEVEHRGNANSSPEEASVVARCVRALLARKWRDRGGQECDIGVDDVLVVTPFNAQIRTIERALEGIGSAGIAVGTVDRFQGRQAPVVIYSMASSSAEDAPRGMEFLYDLHRLNVATSRAMAMAIVVCSPQLLRAPCDTPHQIELVNALCRLREMAGGGEHHSARRPAQNAISNEF